jgi:FlaA1/EpsC-like NDP-sugar epimerase
VKILENVNRLRFKSLRSLPSSIASMYQTAEAEAGNRLRSRLRTLSRIKRLALVGILHLAIIPTATYLAFWLRFDGSIPPEYLMTFAQTLPWLFAVRGLTFVPFGLYGGLWRYTGVWDLSRIVLAVFTSSSLLYLLVYRQLGPSAYPRSIVAIDSLLLVFFLGGARLLWRVVPILTRARPGRRVLIIGAGDAGDMIVREMLKSGGYEPVGFVDDDWSKLGHTIHGIKVLGTRADLPRVVAATGAREALVAIPSATPATIRSFVRLLEDYKVPITTLPSLSELVNGQVGVKQIRPLAIEDLLPRSQVCLNPEDGRRLVKGKRVLVTGAGGSIGSELCRQIGTLEPSELILYERYENSLFAIANDLADRGVRATVHSVIGDVTDAARTAAVFAQHRPHLVFHAAAHKHVPLMEGNPCEAIKNNVVGTRVVAETSRRFGVERFVLVSTDKAVNPTSVMGASKRVAELIVQAISRDAGETLFVTVRFGNVLGSNGSVIPRMLDQIRAGGPVTVTDPEIRRYFMLIPEAAQLVLQAAVFAHERATFVLDMGEQIKVLDVARNLIRLSGFVPDEEIPIKIIGLRPGEKLYEELVGKGEAFEPSGIEKIFRLRETPVFDRDEFENQVASLVRAAGLGRSNEVFQHLCQIVPSFKPGVLTATEGAEAPIGSTGPVLVSNHPAANTPAGHRGRSKYREAHALDGPEEAVTHVAGASERARSAGA